MLNERTFLNPIIPRNRPDPSVTFTAPDPVDGKQKVWVYSTRNYGAETINVPVECGENFNSIKYAGDALPVRPEWALKPRYEPSERTGLPEDVSRNFWAPQVLPGNGVAGERGKYYLFGCCGYDEDGVIGRDSSGMPVFDPAAPFSRLEWGFALYVAVADNPRGPFVDSGVPLEYHPGYRVLDPMVFVDPPTGVPYLLWGSHHQPVQLRELDPSLLRFSDGSAPRPILECAECPFERLREGAFLHFRPDCEWSYQLYVSGDNVWEDGRYGVTVHVAKAVKGPYLGVSQIDRSRASNLILGPSSRFERTGHNSIFTDAAGNDFIVYHARDNERPVDLSNGELLRMTLADPIRYDQYGLPYVENGVASLTPQALPSIR